MWKIQISLILFLCISLLHVKGQNYSELEYRTLDIKDGLSHSNINTLYKDKKGFIWIGTITGLCRFDGIELIQYKELDSHSVTTINEDNSGCLFIGTDKGLFELKLLTNKIVKKDFASNSNLIINTIIPITDHHLLIGTDKGLFYIQNEKIEKILIDNPLAELIH